MYVYRRNWSDSDRASAFISPADRGDVNTSRQKEARAVRAQFCCCIIHTQRKCAHTSQWRIDIRIERQRHLLVATKKNKFLII